MLTPCYTGPSCSPLTPCNSGLGLQYFPCIRGGHVSFHSSVTTGRPPMGPIACFNSTPVCVHSLNHVYLLGVPVTAHTAGTLSGQAPSIASWFLPAPTTSTGTSGPVPSTGILTTTGILQIAPVNPPDAEEVVHPFNNPCLPPSITSCLLKVIKAGASQACRPG